MIYFQPTPPQHPDGAAEKERLTPDMRFTRHNIGGNHAFHSALADRHSIPIIIILWLIIGHA